MKRPSSRVEMRKEYDFRGGVRGKYAKRYAKGVNIFVLKSSGRTRKKTA